MATAALKVNATVQYCMSLARLVMMAAELPALTQFRAGDDYGPGQTTKCSFPYCVYYIGTTSLLGWALDLAPSKDNFWSTTIQPGSAFHNATEPYPSMEAAIATYSTAPVQLGDGVGFTNVSLALATCTSAGRLLQPSRPSTAIDACFAAAAGLGSGPAFPVAQRDGNYPVMSTFTAVGGRAWVHILTIGLAAAASITPPMLPLDVAPPLPGEGGLLAYAGWREAGGGSFAVLGNFTAATPITLAAAPDPHQWTLTHAAPILSSGWALLGEAAKLVPVSVWRVEVVTDVPGGGVAVGVRGEPGEEVGLAFAKPGGAAGWSVVNMVCKVGAEGSATITYDAGGGKCA